MDEQANFEPEAVLSPRRSGWSRLAVVLPVVALIGIVWVGIRGRGPDANGGDGGQGAAAAQASTAAASTEPTPAVLPATAAYPATVLGLEVRSLADLDPATADGDAAVAIAGWYVEWPSLGCPSSSNAELPSFVFDLGLDANRHTFCDRSGLIVATPNPAGSINVGGANDHPYGSQPRPALPFSLTPGTVVPADVSDSNGSPVQVIVIGRIVATSPPTAQVTSGRQLLVDRVVWANGRGRPQTASILPALLDQGPQLTPDSRDQLAARIVGQTGSILLETLVDQRILAAVDPHAADLVAAAAPKAQRIWYRRTLGPDASPESERWVAMDDATDQAIAGGWVGIAPEPRLPADGVNVLSGG